MAVILKNHAKLVLLYTLTRNISIKFSNYVKYEDLYHPEGREPKIPVYNHRREIEDVDLKKARLIYQSRKRGMLENGLMLSTFANKYLNNFNEKQLSLYDTLINKPSNDWDLFYWAAGVKPTPDEYNHEVMDLLKKHVRNDDRKARLLQPDLY